MLITEQVRAHLRAHLRLSINRVRTGEIDAESAGYEEALIARIRRMDDDTFERYVDEQLNACILALGIKQSGVAATPHPQEDAAALFFSRGMKSYTADNYNEAKKFFKRAVEIHPPYKAAWLALSAVYEALGDTTRANRARLEAAALDT